MFGPTTTAPGVGLGQTNGGKFEKNLDNFAFRQGIEKVFYQNPAPKENPVLQRAPQFFF